MPTLDDPLSTVCRACPASGGHGPARARPRPSRALSAAPLELSAHGLTWVHLERPTRPRPHELAERFGWHELDVEDVLSKRQRPKVDEYPEYLFVVLHFPVYDKTIQRLNAAELDVFLGPDYLVTLPNVELLPVSRLFARCEDDEACATSLFAKGSGYLLYHVLDDLFDYCFPILDKIGHKLDPIEDDMFERRAEEVVRDISNVKQEIISLPQDHQARALDPAPARAPRRALPARGARALLRRHRRRGRADLGPARQLQGGRRGARVDERVGDLAPPERRPAGPDRLQRPRCCR